MIWITLSIVCPGQVASSRRITVTNSRLCAIRRRAADSVAEHADGAGHSDVLRSYNRFSGPTIAHIVFPDGVGALPQARLNAATIRRPAGMSPAVSVSRNAASFGFPSSTATVTYRP